MASLYEYLLERQELARNKLADLMKKESGVDFKQQFGESLANLMAIQFMIEHKNYGRGYDDETDATPEIQSNILTSIDAQRKLLFDGAIVEIFQKDLVRIVFGENGSPDDLTENVIKTEDIKARFLQHTGRKDILTEDEQREDDYWLSETKTQAKEAREEAFTRGEISEEDAKYHLATAIALTQISPRRKASQADIQSRLEEERKEIMNGTTFQRATEGKSGAEIAAICGELDPETKTFKSYQGDDLDQSYRNAVVAFLRDKNLDAMHNVLKREKFNRKEVRYDLTAVILFTDVLDGKLKVGKTPTNLKDWDAVRKEQDKRLNDPSYKWIEKMNRVKLIKMCGEYNEETKAYTPYSKEVIFNNFEVERQKQLEQQKQKAAEEAKLKEEPKVEEKSEEELRKEQREKVLRERDEAERKNALSDEEIAGLDVQQVGQKLSAELAKLEHSLNRDYRYDTLADDIAKNVASPLEDAKDVESLQALIEKTEKLLNGQVYDTGKTLAEFAKEEHLLGANFDRLMKRAREISGLDRQAEEEKKAAEEAKQKEEAEKKAAEEQPKEAPKVEEQKVEEQPKVEEQKVEGQPVEEQPVEEQPVEEPKEKPFDSAERIAYWQRFWAGELEKQLGGPEDDFDGYRAYRALCHVRALQEMKESGFVGTSDKEIEDLADSNSLVIERKHENISLLNSRDRSELTEMFGKTENGAYHLNTPEQVVKAFADGVEQVKREREQNIPPIDFDNLPENAVRDAEQQVEQAEAAADEMKVIADLYDLYSNLSEDVANAGLKDLGPALAEAVTAFGDYLENQTLEEKQERLETADSIFTKLMKNEAFKKIVEDKKLIQKQSELMNRAKQNIGLEQQEQPQVEEEQVEAEVEDNDFMPMYVLGNRQAHALNSLQKTFESARQDLANNQFNREEYLKKLRSNLAQFIAVQEAQKTNSNSSSEEELNSELEERADLYTHGNPEFEAIIGGAPETVMDMFGFVSEETGEFKLFKAEQVVKNYRNEAAKLSLDQLPQLEPPKSQFSEKDIAKFNKEETALKLYNELGYLSRPVYFRYGMNASDTLLEAQTPLASCKNGEEFKKAVKGTENLLNTKLPNSEETFADFAKRNNLLPGTFYKLLDHAKELALTVDKKVEAQKEELVDGKKFFYEAAEKQLNGLHESAAALGDNGNNVDARQKFSRHLSRLIAVNKVRENWGDPEKLDKDQIENVNEEIEIQTNTIAGSPEFQSTIKRLSGRELLKMVCEKGNLDNIKLKSPDAIVNAYTREANHKTAAKWIEDFKQAFRTDPDKFKSEPDYPMVHIARIMAARKLSNSTRGKASTLNERLYEDEIQAHAENLMKKDSFKKFAEELKQDNNKMRKVEAIFTKRFSHGGELDDSFRSYLTNRPAGELQNDPDLKRWMPTIKQRVEKLQKDAAKAIKQQKTPYVAAAEIVALRQMAEVQRGGRGLEANIPVVGEKDGNVKDLSRASKNLAEDQNFKEAFDKQEVKKYILSGHGGAMVENYEKAVKEEVSVEHADVQLNK